MVVKKSFLFLGLVFLFTISCHQKSNYSNLEINEASGIVNGIDDEIWNPKTDSRISSNYDSDKLKKRFLNKLIIERRFGLERDDGILHAIVSRLTWQKGLDVFLECLDPLIASGARLAVIGQGEPELETAFYKASEKYKGRIGLYVGYDESLAHTLFSGADTIQIGRAHV